MEKAGAEEIIARAKEYWCNNEMTKGLMLVMLQAAYNKGFNDAITIVTKRAEVEKEKTK
jgi:hypothetical protein